MLVTCWSVIVTFANSELLTLLLRQTTGHMEQPRLQQQQRNPNSSQRTLTGSAFLRVTFTRVTVAWRRIEMYIS